MEKYAHISTTKDINLFFEYMLYDKKIKTEEEKKEVEAGFFAMCLLLPRDQFIKIADAVGGLEKVYEEPEAVARFFRVEDILVRTRAKDLMDREKEEQNITLASGSDKTESYKNSKVLINKIKK